MRGRPKKLENLSTREVAEMHTRVKRALVIKRNEERDRIIAAVDQLVKRSGFKDVKDIIR
jgi:hypothetical protein